MKRVILFILLFSILKSLDVYSQVISGFVLDQKNNPVAFANILLLSISDSTYVIGGISDNNGAFNIELNEITDTEFILKISFVGYTTEYVNATIDHPVTILLKESSLVLDDVMVSASKKIFKINSEGLKADIKGSVLNKSGTAINVIKELPFIVDNQGKIEVLGKGEPLIYINNKVVRNKDELEQLKSTEIESVEIISNPGSQYSSATGSVIKVTTIAEQGEGFSGVYYNALRIHKKIDNNTSAKTFYRYRGFEAFLAGSFKCSNNIHDTFINATLYDKNNDTGVIDYQSPRNRLTSNMWTITGGVSCDINKDNNIGIRYNYNGTPDKKLISDYNTKQSNPVETDTINANSKEKFVEDNFSELNLYYNGKIGKTSISFNADYIYRKSKRESLINEYYSSGQVNDVILNNGAKFNLYSSRLDLSNNIWGGKLEYGGDYTHTDGNLFSNIYDSKNNGSESITKSKESQYNLYLIYSRQFEPFSISIGARNEYSVIEYKADKKYRDYNNEFLPFATASFKIKNLSGSLSFRGQINRPTYKDLFGGLFYVNSYTLQGDNPELKPSVSKSLNLSLMWKDFSFTGSFIREKNYIFFDNNKMDNEYIIYMRPINLESFNRGVLSLYYNPTIGFWKPMIGFSSLFQNIKHGDPVRKYNKPSYIFIFNNKFILPANIIMALDFNYYSKGNLITAYRKEMYNLNFSISKTFMNNKLTFTLRGEDLLGNSEYDTRLLVNNIDFNQKTKIYSRSILFSISYNFNNSKDRYKGKVLDAERKRIK